MDSDSIEMNGICIELRQLKSTKAKPLLNHKRV